MKKTIIAIMHSLCLAPAILAAQTATDRTSDSSNKTMHAASYDWMLRTALRRDLAYGDDSEQRLDLYLQGDWTGEPKFFDVSAVPRPTLLYIHGGGWVVRDRQSEPWIFPFIEQGWHVVSMTYRLGPGTAPLAVDDGVCALRWIADNAEVYGFDRKRIVVAGVSAGGHLALTTGILSSRSDHDCFPGDGLRVRAIINWVGITDIGAVAEFLEKTQPEFGNYAQAWIGDESRMEEISQAYSPVKIADANMPPVLTIHGTADTVVPFTQAVTLHETLDTLGVENELVPLQGGTHGGFSREQFSQAMAAMLRFVSQR